MIYSYLISTPVLEPKPQQQGIREIINITSILQQSDLPLKQDHQKTIKRRYHKINMNPYPLAPCSPGAQSSTTGYSSWFEMLVQTRLTIKHLLQYLTSMYLAHGIDFNVTGLYTTLMRMLTPFELAAYFELDQVNAEDQQQQEKMENTANKQSKGNRSLQHKQARNLIKKGCSQKKIEIQEQYYSGYDQRDSEYGDLSQPEFQHTKTVIPNLGVQIPKTHACPRGHRKSPLTHKKVYKLGKGARPLLSTSQQKQIRTFILSEFRKGRTLTIKAIAEEARRIYRGEGHFLGSQGWVKNFFNRHPDLWELYKQSRITKNLGLLPQGVAIVQRADQEGNEDHEGKYGKIDDDRSQNMKTENEYVKNQVREKMLEKIRQYSKITNRDQESDEWDHYGDQENVDIDADNRTMKEQEYESYGEQQILDNSSQQSQQI